MNTEINSPKQEINSDNTHKGNLMYKKLLKLISLDNCDDKNRKIKLKTRLRNINRDRLLTQVCSSPQIQLNGLITNKNDLGLKTEKNEYDIR